MVLGAVKEIARNVARGNVNASIWVVFFMRSNPEKPKQLIRNYDIISTEGGNSPLFQFIIKKLNGSEFPPHDVSVSITQGGMLEGLRDFSHDLKAVFTVFA